jgi:hypothetical protein
VVVVMSRSLAHDDAFPNHWAAAMMVTVAMTRWSARVDPTAAEDSRQRKPDASKIEVFHRHHLFGMSLCNVQANAQSLERAN